MENKAKWYVGLAKKYQEELGLEKSKKRTLELEIALRNCLKLIASYKKKIDYGCAHWRA